MKILAIETSCDETAIAIAEFCRNRGQTRARTRTNADKNIRVTVLSHIVSSQAKLHAKFGGVVPHLAKREHQRNLVPILLAGLREGGLFEKRKSAFPREGGLPKIEKILEREPELLGKFKKSILPIPPPEIDAIAVTYGPGLAPCLWVGVNFAKALAYLWKKPLIPTNHMAGHFFSAFLQQRVKGDAAFRMPDFKFPMLALLVSGNHTELVLVKKPWRFRPIGSTLDDAAGEAFDKVARIMGFPYPGGPAISRLAEKGDPKRYPLPSPMLHSKDYNFSFSGLKTAALYLIRDITGSMSWKTKTKLTTQQKADIAASFEKAAVNVLVKKTVRAAKEYKVKTILLGGGVAANRKLRHDLGAAVKKELPSSPLEAKLTHMDGKFRIPSSDLCGDNALMIATAAYFTGKKKAWRNVHADANAKLDQ